MPRSMSACRCASQLSLRFSNGDSVRDGVQAEVGIFEYDVLRSAGNFKLQSITGNTDSELSILACTLQQRLKLPRHISG